MELGISLATGSRAAPGEAARHLVARGRAAAAAGLASMTVGDSHAVGHATHLQNVPALARLLSEWDERPAGCLFLLPLWSPVLVAEQVATLAAFHDGPFIVQTGIGGSPHQLRAMQRTGDHRLTVVDESIRVIDELLRGWSVSSEVFGFADVAVGATPVDTVDWWMGTMVEAGVRRAARLGAAWYASPKVEPDEFRRLDDAYRAACDEHGTTPRVMLRTDALVLPDGDRATRLAGAAIDTGYRGMALSHLLVGSPDRATEQLAAWAERGVDQIVARTMGVEPDVDLETIAALGEVRRSIAR